MSKIDTSTTAGKIAVMQAFEGGKDIEYRNGDLWFGVIDSGPCWDWACTSYRIKPQTVEEAAQDWCSENLSMVYSTHTNKSAFVAGAQWQKDQDNE